MSDDVYEIARQAEQARSDAQLRGGTVADLVAASRRRHDALAAATLAASGETIACRAGCSFCCSFRVAVRADEALLLADHLRATRSAGEVDALRERFEAAAAALSGMTVERRMRTNLACALLAEGRCSVYEVRPHTCRAFHAVDVEGCEASVVDPERSDIAGGQIPVVQWVSAGHDDGLVDTLEGAGLDVTPYEMNAAMAAALASDAPRERYEAGELVFPGAGFED